MKMKFELFAAIILFVTITGNNDIVFKRGGYYRFQSFHMMKTETWYQCIQMCFHYKLCTMIIFKIRTSKCAMYPVSYDKMSKWSAAAVSPKTYLVKKEDATKVFNESCPNYSCPLDSFCEHVPPLGFICSPMNKGHDLMPYDMWSFLDFTWTLCEDRWVPFADRCIQIKIKKKLSDAKVACGANSAELVSVNTEEEEALLVEITLHYASSSSFVNTNFTHMYWINMIDETAQPGCFALSPKGVESHFENRSCDDEFYFICQKQSTFTNYVAN